MKCLLNFVIQFLLVLVLGISFSGCVIIYVFMVSISFWQVIDFDIQVNLLDVVFIDSCYGYLVGSNWMIREINDGGVYWNECSFDLFDEENFCLISIDFNGDEGWIVG